MPKELTPITKVTSARRNAEPKMRGGNANGNRSKAVERQLAKKVQGERVPMSGGGRTKGDVLTRYTFYEVKTSSAIAPDGEKIIGLKRAWLYKMKQEAAIEQKLIPVLLVHYKGDGEEWAVIPFDTVKQMVAQLEGLYTLSDWLDRNPKIAEQLPAIEMPGLGKPLFTIGE
jgi:hypothetical protein